MAGLVQKFKQMWTPPEDEYDYDFEEMDMDDEEVMDEISSSSYEEEEAYQEPQRESRRSSAPQSGNKVVNIHAAAQLQVVLFKPERFGDETRSVADELIKMHTVVLNLENTSKDVSRPILDFLSGVAYANNGKIKRVSTATFIITPYNVDLTGDDLMDEIESSSMYL